MSFFDAQNPGIGGLQELTPSEAAYLTRFAGLTYSNGYYLQIIGGMPVWAPLGGGGSVGIDDVLAVNQPLTTFRYIDAGSNNVNFQITGNQAGLNIDAPNAITEIGDYQQFGNGSKVSVDDSNGIILANTYGSATMGDIGNFGTPSYVQVDVTNKRITLYNPYAADPDNFTGSIAIYDSDVATGQTSNGWVWSLQDNTTGIGRWAPAPNNGPISNFNNFGSVPNSFGFSVTGGIFNLQPASTSFGGGVSTTTQAFAGAKSFNNSLAVGTTSSAVASAQVEIVSTTRGFLPPRMTTTQRTAISSPAEGLLVYDLTLHKLYGWDGTAWQAAW